MAWLTQDSQGSGGDRVAAGTRDTSGYWWFVVPAILMIVFLFALPLGWAAWLSLRNFNLMQGTDRFIGFHNFLRIVSDRGFLHALALTLVFVVTVTILDFIFGFAEALLLYEVRPRLSKVFRAIFLLPILLIPSASSMFWKMIMYGSPNVQLLRIFGLEGIVPPPLSDPGLAMPAIILTTFWAWSPWAFLLLLAGLESLDSSPIEAAKLDGASYMRIVWHVILPMMRPTIFVIMSFKAVDSFLTFSFVWLMTQGGPGGQTHILSTYIYERSFRFLDYGYGSAMALVMVAISGVLSVAAAIYWQRAQGRGELQ